MLPSIKDFGGINKKHSVEEFKDLDVESIEDLTYVEGDIDSKEYLNRKEFHQILKLKLKSKTKSNVIASVRQLEKSDRILSAEPNMNLVIPLLAQETPWGITKIKAATASTGAWSITKGSPSVKVAVLDSGFDMTHPDLIGNIDTTLSEDFTYNLLFGSPDLNDYIGHGTHIAGTIAAVDNTIGVVGIAPNIKLVNLKVVKTVNGQTEIDPEDSARAVNYCINNNIPIINYSAGGNIPGNQPGSNLYNKMKNYTGLIVCGAGNGQEDNGLVEFYPANYDLPNIISVGASNSDDT